MRRFVPVAIAALLLAAGACEFRAGAEARRDAEGLFLRQPGDDVDPRGIDDRRPGPGDGRVQQSRHVRPARAAEPGSTRSCPIWRPNGRGTRSAQQLTFRLRQGVKWHDGKPFTAKDVKCTFDLLLGNAAEKLRLNPRKPWYRNLDEVVAEGR